MGSGSTAYRITKGQSAGIMEHTLEMIPIQEKQAESDLKIRQMAFEQEIGQAEKMGLLSQKLSRAGTQPVFVTESAADQAADQAGKPNYTIIIVLGILAVLFFKKKGKL